MKRWPTIPVAPRIPTSIAELCLFCIIVDSLVYRRGKLNDTGMLNPQIGDESASSLPAIGVTVGFAGLEELLQFFFELADVFEVAIDAGEADVGYGVEFLQLFHDEFANLAGGSFAVGGVHEEGFGGVDDGFEVERGDGAFLAGAEEAGEDFGALEFFAAAIFFDDHVGDFVDAFVGGEAALTLFALAAAANGIRLFAFAAVYDAVLGEGTEGAFHQWLYFSLRGGAFLGQMRGGRIWVGDRSGLQPSGFTFDAHPARWAGLV